MASLSTDNTTMEVGPPPSLSPSVSQTLAYHPYSCKVIGTVVHFYDDANHGTKYEADVTEFLPSLTPKLTKAGKVAVRQPRIPWQSKHWWTVQCEFRGLSVSGDVRELQERVREHGDRGLSVALKDLCGKMKKQYVATNRLAIEIIWRNGDNNEKANLWPRRLLHESFIASGSSTEVLVLDAQSEWGAPIMSQARLMNIYYMLAKNPGSMGHARVVLGRNELAVSGKVAEINHGMQQAYMRLRQAQDDPRLKEQDPIKIRLATARAMERVWDVTGEWEITCPYMDEQWGSRGRTCSLTMGLTRPNDGGLVQIWTNFDFIAISGIMRFVSLDAPVDGPEEAKEERYTRTHGLVLEDEDEDEHTPLQFLFPISSLPAYQPSEFKFRWRGEDTRTGEIELHSDKALCSMTIESPNALTGVFISDAAGEVEFKGSKKELSAEMEGGGQQERREILYRADPSFEWSKRSKDAHERGKAEGQR